MKYNTLKLPVLAEKYFPTVFEETRVDPYRVRWSACRWHSPGNRYKTVVSLPGSHLVGHCPLLS